MDESPWKQPLRNPTQLKKESLRRRHVDCSHITIIPPPKPPDDELPPTAVGTPLVETAVVEDFPWLKEFANLRRGQGAKSEICKLGIFLKSRGQMYKSLQSILHSSSILLHVFSAGQHTSHLLSHVPLSGHPLSSVMCHGYKLQGDFGQFFNLVG
ncbi:unnamed protein product [Trifolium pratense]|uniref:Uncharacterized protein n=1 Tax=Trifolium pratense TaxID=57577 RepID=A0ACB0LUD8_TRIPR|nr:unnamed protein product [Trifolium pratense]